jgi:hypothetical protein
MHRFVYKINITQMSAMVAGKYILVEEYAARAATGYFQLQCTAAINFHGMRQCQMLH